MIKLLTLLFFIPLFLFGGSLNTHIIFIGKPIAALRTITQAFNAVGYKFEPNTLRVENNSGEFSAIVTGSKVFNVGALQDSLKMLGIKIENIHIDSQVLTMMVDTQNGDWNVLVLGKDDGVELKRVSSAQWFRIEEGQVIRIEPPYIGKWYPDVAIFSSTMELLLSFRSTEPKDELEFILPQGAHYLKISNTQGMKVMKEGMWIESVSSSR